MFLKLIKKWYSVRRVFILIFSIVFIFLFGRFILSITQVSGDTASHLLLSVSPLLEIGSPYRDFWDIKPPVWPLVMYLWSSIFGFGILSIKIINVIIAIGIMFISGKIYQKVFQTPVFEMVFIFTTVVVFSPILNTFLVPTEMIGLFFSMGALLVLVNVKKDLPRFYFSGLLFFAASQTKEPFAFTILAVLPIFFDSLLKGGFAKFFKNSLQFLLGILTSVAGIYIYLTRLGSFEAYILVFKYKQIFYPFKFDVLTQNFLPGIRAAERTFTEFFYGFSILIILATISFYFVNKFKKTLNFNRHNSSLRMKPLVILNSELVIKYSVFFYALGSFLGFGLGYTFGSHYLIQVVAPFYMMGGLIVSYIFRNSVFMFKKPKFYLSLFLFALSIIVLMPKRQYVSSYLTKNTNFVVANQVSQFEKRITELTTKDQCVLSVYGWGVSENYLYSGRRPCTRFFLANIVLQDWQKKEYADSIINNPPAVIAYQTQASDMDIQRFESEVINISKIIKNCYTQDIKENIIFIPKFSNTGELRNCIKDNSI